VKLQIYSGKINQKLKSLRKNANRKALHPKETSERPGFKDLSKRNRIQPNLARKPLKLLIKKANAKIP